MKIKSISKEKITTPSFEDVREWYEKHLHPDANKYDDHSVYEKVYHQGNWCGIFQCTSGGAQKLFQNAKPESIVDIAVLTSIYRPGPLAAKVDQIYLDAKNNGKKFDWGHPLFEKVLGETYNCLIFQESVMALAEHVGGFPKEKCDDVRRAIMKRDLSKGDAAIKEAKKMEDEFVSGAMKNGVPEETARKAYQNILWFAGYGFNRAHAVAYAIDSYMCAWLSTHYEPEWLCTYLESMSANSEDRSKAFSEVKNLGYTIKSVDINQSGSEWTALPNKILVQSFGTIKGVGEAAINEIMLQRPYNTIEDLLWKTDGSWKHSKFNKRVFESLIKTFSFDSMNIVGEDKLFKNYKQMYWVIIEHYDQLKKKNGKELFYKLVKESQDIEDWSFNEKIEMQLELIGDINVLDYINPNTLQKLKEKGVESLSETDFDESPNKICWFLVMSSKETKTKNGKQYVQLTIVGLDGKQHKVFAWNIINSEDVPCGRAYIAELEKTQFGLTLRGKKIKELA